LSELAAPDGPARTVQYFERARFELHADGPDGRPVVRLGAIGREAVADRQEEVAFQPVAGGADGAVFFPATGHTLGGVFRQQWEATGGAEVYGEPISEPLEERWRAGGVAYAVQYFERARMEHQPTWAGTPKEVRLGRLGTALYTERPSPRVSP
jgi:hypothetical protein